MRTALILHPDSRFAGANEIEVEVLRPSPVALSIRFLLSGTMRGLRIPPLAAPVRSDGLWRRTCFEAFVRAGDEHAYVEHNFSPSGEWAAYRFDDYRTGMREEPSERLSIHIHQDDDKLTLAADFDVALQSDSAWRLGLAAIIEDQEGARSYWALTHPPGPPDFHHRDCFAIELSAAERR